MPAKSEAQRRLFAIAEHHPDQLFDKNKKILGSMSKGQMHDFASTKEKGLPKHVSTEKPDVDEVKVKSAARVDKLKKIKNLRKL
jgi:hypothetical protein